MPIFKTSVFIVYRVFASHFKMTSVPA